jgi:NAD-dependent dihydropyrimidine dehydrogenase PreA subunit
MKIDKETCIGCEACHAYCPMGAISTVPSQGAEVSEVNQDECVECGVCLRAKICPTDSILRPELQWPRLVRALFSDPLTQHPSTRLEGRGTEEMKTNDVTGRFPRGVAGIAVEMGRPGLGTTFRDIQTVSMALAEAGVHFEPENPLSALIVDKKVGSIDSEILNEKVLSAIIEFSVRDEELKEVLAVLKQVSGRIETVFSLCLIRRAESDGTFPVLPIALEAGFKARPNTKTNVGLGRPLKEDNRDDSYAAPKR